MQVNWTLGESVIKVWNSLTIQFRGRICLACHSKHVDVYLLRVFGKTNITVACWDCGTAQLVSRFKDN